MAANAGILDSPQPGKGKKQKTSGDAGPSASRSEFFASVSDLEYIVNPFMQFAGQIPSYLPEVEIEDAVSDEQGSEESGPTNEDNPADDPDEPALGTEEADEPEEADSGYLTTVWESFLKNYGLDGLTSSSEQTWSNTADPMIKGIFGAVKIAESVDTIRTEWRNLRQGSWWLNTRMMIPGRRLSGEDAQALAKIVGASESLLSTTAKLLLPVGTTCPMTMFSIYMGATGVRTLLRIWEKKLKRMGDDTGEEEVDQQTTGEEASRTPSEEENAERDSPPAVRAPRHTEDPPENGLRVRSARTVHWPTSSGSGGVAQLKRNLNQFRVSLQNLIDTLDHSYRDTLGAKKAFGELTEGSRLKNVRRVGDNLAGSAKYLRAGKLNLEASISLLNSISKRL